MYSIKTDFAQQLVGERMNTSTHGAQTALFTYAIHWIVLHFVFHYGSLA